MSAWQAKERKEHAAKKVRLTEPAPPDANMEQSHQVIPHERDDVSPEPAKRVRVEEPVATPGGDSASSSSTRVVSPDAILAPTGGTTNTRPSPTTVGEDADKRRKLGDSDGHMVDECALDILELAEQERGQRLHADAALRAEARQSSEVYLAAQGVGRRERDMMQADLLKLGCHSSVHVAEIFSPPRMTQACSRFGLSPGLAFDLRTGWDLNCPRQRSQVWEYIKRERPILIFGSPECRSFSQLQNLNPKGPQFQRKLAEGIAHIDFMVAIYRWQASQGRLFVHEQPWGNNSWKLKSIVELCSLPGVSIARCDQCTFGQHTWDSEGNKAYARKRTGFVTNCEEIYENLSRECPGKHRHFPLIGGRALHCAQYPVRLVHAVLRGLKCALVRIGALDSLEAGPTVEEPCPAAQVDYDRVYYDEVTGIHLPSHLCEEAMKLEIKYMQEMEVYTEVTKSFCVDSNLTPIGTRWIFTNKGDTKNPIIRARLVAQETKSKTTMDPNNTAATFAATPPIEGLRTMLSRVMTGPAARSAEDEIVLGFFDISRAHFHSPVRRQVVIRVPKEDGSITSGLAILGRAMYGTKDAAQCFDAHCETIMTKMNYKVGVFNPCLYSHLDNGTAVDRHGDDFIVAGTRQQIAEFGKKFGAKI